MLIRNYEHRCAESGKKQKKQGTILHCFASSLSINSSRFGLPVSRGPFRSRTMSETADSSAGPGGPRKEDVVNKIVTFLSDQMEQDTEFQIYTTDIMDVFKKEFSDRAKQDAFKEGLVTLQETLATMGLQPEGHPITVVPQGVVKTFFVNPMQLGYRPEDALKGACM